MLPMVLVVLRLVSTHSRPEAAGQIPVSWASPVRWFQLTAARRRLDAICCC